MFKKFETEKDVVVIKGSGKVFTAGGDVKDVVKCSVHGTLTKGYKNSHKTYEMLANYSKPFVALTDGLAMGGAAIYCTPGRYRVVTERTSFSMPETAIGYFNDAGASFFLSRLSGNFGVFMGMTGYQVKGYDMIKVGLASHYVESSKLDELEMELGKCKAHAEVNQVLDHFASIPATTDSDLDPVMPLIEKCFEPPTVEEIFEKLRLNGNGWAKDILKTLKRMSPTSLKVTHRSINLGRNLSMRECLKMELRLVHNHITLPSDLKEGCRAVLIDKDNKPNWNPKTLTEVTDEHVRSFFKFIPEEYESLLDDKKTKL